MLTHEERAVVIDLSDRLIDLYVRRDDAVENGDLRRADRLQTEIEAAAANRQQLLQSEEAQ